MCGNQKKQCKVRIVMKNGEITKTTSQHDHAADATLVEKEQL